MDRMDFLVVLQVVVREVQCGYKLLRFWEQELFLQTAEQVCLRVQILAPRAVVVELLWN
jgi:hypothetical protein